MWNVEIGGFEMSKFKVGDKVRVLDGSNIENYNCGWVESMHEFVGEMFTVKYVYSGHAVSLEGNIFTWDERGLELVK